jgi:DNA-binding response OmpR family regulator
MGSTPQRLSQLQQALQAGDADLVYKSAHYLKGSAGQLGAFRMHQTGAAIEALARVGSLNGVEPLLKELSLEFERVGHDLGSAYFELVELEQTGTGNPKLASHDEAAYNFPLELISSAFRDRRLLALDVYPAVLAQLRSNLVEMGCELIEVSELDLDNREWPFGGSLLFLGVRTGRTNPLRHCLELKERGAASIPTIMISPVADSELLQIAEQLGSDFVLEPFRTEEILLRAYRKLRLGFSSERRDLDVKLKGLLAAEDDPLIARFLVSTLNAAGFAVTHVPDGEAALAALQERTFQLCILDINMPKTDGYSVLSKLRLQAQHKSMPVVMLSSRVQEHDIVRAFDLGADDYVTKPFNPFELISRVRRLVRKPNRVED